MEDKKLTKVERLEKALKEAKKIEKEKYDKSREKYRLKLGKIIDEILDGKTLDLKKLKTRVKEQKKFILIQCEKESTKKTTISEEDKSQTTIMEFIDK